MIKKIAIIIGTTLYFIAFLYWLYLAFFALPTAIATGIDIMNPMTLIQLLAK